MSYADIKPGTRVRLVRWFVWPVGTDDNITVPPGTEGTVEEFESSTDPRIEPQLVVHWDNDISLGVLPRDQIEVIQ